MAYIPKQKQKRTIEKEKREEKNRIWLSRSTQFKIKKYEEALLSYPVNHPDVPKMKKIIKEYKKKV